MIATSMLLSLNKMVKKAQNKIVQEKEIIKEIKMTEEVNTGKKEELLKIGYYLRDNNIPKYAQKLDKME